jgi:competence protein ComEA
VAEATPEPSVDERSRAALEALRAASDRGARAPVELGATAWWEHVERALEGRWPGVSPGTWRVALVALGVAVGLAAAVVVVPMLGADGGDVDGGEAPSTLPFTTTTAAPVPPSTVPARLVAHAAGAVAAPGVHEVAAGARVADLLTAAGGPTPDADLDRVNLAAHVTDGQRLYVPRRGEAAPPAVVGGSGGGGEGGGAGGAPGDTATGAGGPLDLNAADAGALDALPGVGPSTASAIVEHRESKGAFTSVDQLLDVRGIGPAKLEALRDLVTVG